MSDLFLRALDHALTIDDLPSEDSFGRTELIDGSLLITGRPRELGLTVYAGANVIVDDSTLLIPDIVVADASGAVRNGLGVRASATEYVIEITSPSTRRRDLTIKRDVYVNLSIGYSIIDRVDGDLMLSSFGQIPSYALTTEDLDSLDFTQDCIRPAMDGTGNGEATMAEWPHNWAELTQGIGCGMCEGERPDTDRYGIRIHAGRYTDAYLQRADVQRGYTLVIWRGRHVNEPTELNAIEASGYWAEVLAVARALIATHKPLKMNYETLGNSLPHLHTHLVPRFTDDPRPGQPFPLSSQRSDTTIPEAQLQADAEALRGLLGMPELPR